MICYNCKAKNKDGARFCKKCDAVLADDGFGATLGYNYAPAPSKSQSGSTTVKVLIIVIISLMVVGLILGIGYRFLSGSSSSGSRGGLKNLFIGEPDDDLVDEHAYGNFVEKEIDGDKAYYYYETETVGEYATKVYTRKHIFVYDDGEWSYDRCETDVSYRDWKIDGTWELTYDMARAGGAAVINEAYVVRAYIEVKGDKAYIDIYGAGPAVEYMTSGEGSYVVDLSEGKDYFSTPESKFSYTVPGFMPISVNTYLWFNEEKMALDRFYLFRKISDERLGQESAYSDAGSYVCTNVNYTISCYGTTLYDLTSFEFHLEEDGYFYTDSVTTNYNTIEVITECYLETLSGDYAYTDSNSYISVSLCELDSSGNWTPVNGYIAYADNVEGGVEFDCKANTKYKIRLEPSISFGSEAIAGHGHISSVTY